MKGLILMLSAAIALTINVTGQSTAFTYQGRLTDNSMPGAGTYQMRFTLFDAGEGGSQAGDVIEYPNVSVTNGVFTVQLDFGSAFSGASRFLEIAVRKTSSEDYVGF